MSSQADPVNNYRDNYWLTIVSLLKAGIPWELIDNITDVEMHTVIACVQALAEHEQELQEREMRRASTTNY